MVLTLIFNLGEDVYGLEIDAIQEIIEDPPLHYVPRATGVLSGALNFHGRILAVIDLPALLDFAEAQRDHRRVVLTNQFNSLVLTVSGIQRIASLDLSTLQPPPPQPGQRAIRGVAAMDETLVNMLDIEEIINRLEALYAE